MWLILMTFVLNVDAVEGAPRLNDARGMMTIDGVELYVGEAARRAILPRDRFAEIVYTDSSATSVRVAGQVLSMNDSTISLNSGRIIPISGVTRILVGTTSREVDAARLKLIGVGAKRRSMSARSSRHIQMGFGGLIADRDIHTTTFHFSAGWEVVRWGHVGVLAELGAASPMDSAFLVGVLSTDLVLHPQASPTSLDPYLVVGGTYLFRSGGTWGSNIGLGVNVLSGDRADLRIEVRDYLKSGVHLVEFRVGIGF